MLDFSHAADTIALEHDIFDKAGLGKLKAKFFQLGPEAKDTTDRIIYDTITGALYYDKDGTGPAAQVHFAKLAAGLNIMADDFLLMRERAPGMATRAAGVAVWNGEAVNAEIHAILPISSTSSMLARSRHPSVDKAAGR